MAKLVRAETSEGIAIVTIDNPPMNVLSKQVVAELDEVFTRLEEDCDVLVVILTGAGNEAFMAGADIKELPFWLEMDKDSIKKTTKDIHRVLNGIYNLSKPTIAVLNGITFGGGCELALTCDIRIAEEKVKLGLPEVKLGLLPGAGGTQRLPRLIGEAKAKELMFTGDPLTAEGAYKIGLVNKVTANGEGVRVALEMAKKMAGYSSQALSRIKQAVNNGVNTSLEFGLEMETELFSEIFATEDAKEGIQSFINKRPPNFKHC